MRVSAILLMSLLLGACYNDKETILYPETQCTSPTNPSYQTDIVPVLAQYCNACHSGSFPSGSVALDTYGEVKKHVDNGKLIGSITWASGVSPMPKNGNKLSVCNLGKIQAWVTAGALNN
jgi:hypothetical protein